MVAARCCREGNTPVWVFRLPPHPFSPAILSVRKETALKSSLLRLLTFRLLTVTSALLPPTGCAATAVGGGVAVVVVVVVAAAVVVARARLPSLSVVGWQTAAPGCPPQTLALSESIEYNAFSSVCIRAARIACSPGRSFLLSTSSSSRTRVARMACISRLDARSAEFHTGVVLLLAVVLVLVLAVVLVLVLVRVSIMVLLVVEAVVASMCTSQWPSMVPVVLLLA